MSTVAGAIEIRMKLASKQAAFGVQKFKQNLKGLDDVAKGTAMGGFAKLKRESDAAGESLKRTGGRARNAKGQFVGGNKAAGALGSTLRSGMGAIGAAAGFTALAAAVTLSVSAFADLEKAATQVSAITGDMGSGAMGDVAGVQKEILELSQKTEFTASQVGDAFKFMARSGLEFNEIMAASPATLELASAAMMDVGRAADITTNVMKGMGLAVEDLGRVNDVLVKTATSSNNSVSQLGEAFKYVGPVAHTAGVGIESVSAALGILGDAGLQAEMGGTALRGMITKLLAPSKEAKGVLRDFGIEIDQATFETEGFAGVIEKLGPLAGNTGAIMKVFGQRAGPGAAVLLDAGSAAVARLEWELEQAGGTAKRIADAQIATLGGQLNILKSDIEATRIEVGESFAPALQNDLVPALKDVSHWVRMVASDFQDLDSPDEWESDWTTALNFIKGLVVGLVEVFDFVGEAISDAINLPLRIAKKEIALLKQAVGGLLEATMPLGNRYAGMGARLRAEGEVEYKAADESSYYSAKEFFRTGLGIGRDGRGGGGAGGGFRFDLEHPLTGGGPMWRDPMAPTSRPTGGGRRGAAGSLDGDPSFGANPDMAGLSQDDRIVWANTGGIADVDAVSSPVDTGLANAISEADELAGSLSDANAGFNAMSINLPKATGSVGELREELDELTKRQLEDLKMATAGVVVGLMNAAYAAAQGNFGAAGSAVGGMAGGAIGTAIGGPAGGIIGQALGSLLGGVLGDVITELVSVLGVLTPIFDALAVVIRAFSPIFLVLAEYTGALGQSIETIAPVIHPLAEVLAVLLLGFVRFSQVILLVQDAVVVAFGTLVNVATQWIVTIAQNIDTYLARPLIEMTNALYNGVVDIVNTLTNWIRDFTMDDSFGLILSHRTVEANDVIGDFATTEWGIGEYGLETDDLTKATEDNTDQLREFNRSLTNVPTGYRAAHTEYISEEPREPGGDTLYVRLDDSRVIDEVRQGMRRYGNPRGRPTGQQRSETNG